MTAKALSDWRSTGFAPATRPMAEEADTPKSSPTKPSPAPPVAKNAGTARVPSGKPTESKVAPMPTETDRRGRGAGSGSEVAPPLRTSGGGTQAEGVCARATEVGSISAAQRPSAPAPALAKGHARADRGELEVRRTIAPRL